MQISFQEPFAALNPRMRVLGILQEGQAPLLPGLSASARRACIDKPIDQAGLRTGSLNALRMNFPAGSASASRSRARLRLSPS